MNKDNQFKFEEFQSRRKPVREQPTLSFQFDNRLVLNKPAYDLMEQPEAVVVLYDREKNVLALRSAKMRSPNAYNVKPASLAGLTYVINCRGAIHHFGIPAQRSSYNPIMADGLLVIDLNEPISRILAPVEPDDV